MKYLSLWESRHVGSLPKRRKKVRKVCANCHGKTHTNAQRKNLDNIFELYNKQWNGATKMKAELKKKGLLKKNPWKDGFQELMYYLRHHTGRRTRPGAAMNAPDYTHWHGTFQTYQI